MFRFMKIALLTLTIAFIASCSSKPKTETTEAPPAESAQAPDNSAPVVEDKAINFDPQGSDSGKIAGLNTVHFDYDKATLTAEARKQLAENAEWIKAHANVTVQIEGHTDERGSVEYNLSLGERRAKSVRAYLTSLGVDGKRMTIISYGEEKPVASGDNESAYSQNRRANFVPIAQ